MSRPFEHLTIEQVARFPRPGGVVPGRVAFAPDGQAITYLLSEEGTLARGLWRYDIARGERTLLAGPPSQQSFSREEELRRERLRMREEGVTDYAFASDAAEEVLMVPGADGIRVSVAGGPFEDLPDTAGAFDPQLSPDGRMVAFVRGDDLFVHDRGRRETRRLTHDATDGITNGVAEFIAAEELDRRTGFWWSPDSRRLAFVRADSRHVPEYPIVHQGLPRVEIERHRYPFAGEANAYVRLAVIAIESGATEWMDLGADPDFYLARVAWRKDGVLTAQVLSRSQQDLALVAFEGANPRIIHHEHQEPWLNLHDDLRFLDDGAFLWSTEQSGYRHLQLRHADGSLVRDLTSGPWIVTGVVGLDKERRLVYFGGTREGPLERHVYRVSLEGGEVERLTQGPGWHGAVLSKDARRLVVTSSSLQHAPTMRIVDVDGGAATQFFANEGNSAADLGLSVPEITVLTAADGTPLYGMVYAPPQREPGRRYPVVVSVYGGPSAQRVVNEWSSTVDLRAQYLAQHGFVVFKLDNRGTANRGLAFEAALNRDMGNIEIVDQAAGLAWLEDNFHYVDASRAGIYGWSYGGYMTLLCMAKRPDLFQVGVAGAPVTYWDAYDTGYTERYMGTPQENPGGYQRSSVLSSIAGIGPDLLIVHGMIDENVHFRHTARLLVELARHQKQYEILMYPEERHMPRDPKGLEDHERRVLGFIIERLGGR